MAKGLVMLPYVGNNPSAATLVASGKVSVSTNPTVYYGAISGIIVSDPTPFTCYFARYRTNSNLSVFIANITGLANQQSANYGTARGRNGSAVIDTMQFGASYVYAGYTFAYFQDATGNTVYQVKEWFDKGYESYSSLEEVCQAILENSPQDVVNIRYKGNNALLAGPSYVSIGSNVNVYVTTQPGVSVAQSDIVVVKGDTQIPFTYSNNQITFTAQ